MFHHEIMKEGAFLGGGEGSHTVTGKHIPEAAALLWEAELGKGSVFKVLFESFFTKYKLVHIFSSVYST